MDSPVKDPRAEFWLVIEAARKLREETQAERERSARLRLDVRTQVAIARARRAAKAGESPGEPDTDVQASNRPHGPST